MLQNHFSMIRSFGLADVCTLANGACGLIAIFAAMEYRASGADAYLLVAAALIPAAFLFDVLDGRIARMRHAASPLGRELDSLADVISFGVAPAAIAFAAGLDRLLDQVALIYFALCGLSRLARYNVTAEALSTSAGKVAYFEGTPIPTSVVPLALLMIAFHHRNLLPASVLGMEFHWISAAFLVSGTLMISKSLRIPKI